MNKSEREDSAAGDTGTPNCTLEEERIDCGEVRFPKFHAIKFWRRAGGRSSPVIRFLLSLAPGNGFGKRDGLIG